MTAPRPYRAGLGLPEAVTIRSDPPAQQPRQRRPLSPQRSFAVGREDSHDNGYQIPQSARSANWASVEEWNQWNINPTAHGPERIKGPPVFVLGQAAYDELGRSRLDGFGVTVEDGAARKKGLEVEDGAAVADWYRNLSSASSTRPASPAPAPAAVPAFQPRPNEQSQPVDDSIQPLNLSKVPIKAVEAGHRSAPQPVRIHRNEWFIRRALAAQARDPADPSQQPKPGDPGPSSISNLLSDVPAKPKPQQYRYALGPDNKGYELLKDRLGWHGGGLGKPAGWEPPSASSADPGPLELGSTAPPSDGEPSALGVAERPIELDSNGNAIVDLTADSDSDSAQSADAEEEENDDAQGPGRTAPIATTLKLDRLGLGHRRAQARDHLPSTQKKVTHSAREIKEAQKRARYAPPRPGAELGQKGKMRWKDRDKKERDSRMRIAAAINS